MATVAPYFHAIIQRIEKRLASYYGLSMPVGAANFLMPVVPAGADNHPSGKLLVLNQEDLFLGVEWNEAVMEGVKDIAPGKEINARQLAALSVVIEEISHFHLVVQRAAAGLETSQIELEWQGEVDKLVVLAAFSASGSVAGTLHRLHEILTISFRVRSDLSAEETLRYEEATRYFERLWSRRLQPAIASLKAGDPLEYPEVRTYLRQLYWKSWQQKMETLAA